MTKQELLNCLRQFFVENDGTTWEEIAPELKAKYDEVQKNKIAVYRPIKVESVGRDHSQYHADITRQVENGLADESLEEAGDSYGY